MMQMKRQLQSQRVAVAFVALLLGRAGVLPDAALLADPCTWFKVPVPTKLTRMLSKKQQKTKAAAVFVVLLLDPVGVPVDAGLCAHSWRPLL